MDRCLHYLFPQRMEYQEVGLRLQTLYQQLRILLLLLQARVQLQLQ